MLPVIVQPESVFLARVRRLAGSEPASGSVRAKQPSASPEQSRGSHSCFCSSVPQRSIEPATSEVWTETTVRAEESTRPDLLDDQRVAQVVEAAAAVLLGDRGAEVAHLAELRGELAVEAAGPIVVADPRRDLLVAELPRALGDQPLLVCQLEVQGLTSISTGLRSRPSSPGTGQWMGIESNGMILAATGAEGTPVVLVPEKDVEEGSRIK